MTTVKGKSGRIYEVRSELYGTHNLVQRIYFGGVFLAATDQHGPNGESSSTIEETIARADEHAKRIGIEVTEK